MAGRRNAPRGRSRKRRRAGAQAPDGGAPPAGAPVGAPAGAEQGEAKAGRHREAGREGRDERPQAPWHPLPLSELLILVGTIATVVGYARGVRIEGPAQIGGPGAAALTAGVAAVMIGTIEVTLREHLQGYRSHTLLLALLPSIAVYSIVALAVASFTSVPRWLTVALVLLCGALFIVLFRLLRARFQDARRERMFAGRR